MAQLLVVMLICSKYNAKYVVVLCIVQMHRLLLLTINCYKSLQNPFFFFFFLFFLIPIKEDTRTTPSLDESSYKHQEH